MADQKVWLPCQLCGHILSFCHSSSFFQVAKMHSMIWFLFLPLFLVRLCFCQLKRCWGPKGEPTPDLPCDPSSNVSSCCGPNYTCSTNFYCTGIDSEKWVGSCTDIPWIGGVQIKGVSALLSKNRELSITTGLPTTKSGQI